jgi:DNA-binding NarL/FixJ family response regulator
MRVAQQISLDQQSRHNWSDKLVRSVAVRVAVRSRIVLLAADGMQNKQIAEQLNISIRMVTCGGAASCRHALPVFWKMRRDSDSDG